MCNVKVRVVPVDDHQLSAAWAAAVAEDGRRVLFVRRTATATEVAEGYAATLRHCPVRIRLTVAVPAA